MAEPQTLIALEVPRAPVRHSRGEPFVAGDFSIAGVNLLEHVLKAALELVAAESIRLIVAEPDQGVFDMVAKYGVPEVDLGTWLGGVSEQAKVAGQRDCVVFLRASVPMREYSSLARALGAMGELPTLERIEPAFVPKQQPLDQCASLREEPDGRVSFEKWDAPQGSLGVPCPSFEVFRTRSFNPRHFGSAAPQGGAFVWVDEEDFSLTESPLDLIRAERLFA